MASGQTLQQAAKEAWPCAGAESFATRMERARKEHDLFERADRRAGEIIGRGECVTAERLRVTVSSLRLLLRVEELALNAVEDTIYRLEQEAEAKKNDQNVG